MIATLQRIAYESPVAIMLGPFWSAIGAGYAVVIGGRVYITDAGSEYLESCRAS